MVLVVKSALVNNPSSAGAIINQISIMGIGMNSITSINVTTTADQYSYEITVAGT